MTLHQKLKLKTWVGTRNRKRAHQCEWCECKLPEREWYEYELCAYGRRAWESEVAVSDLTWHDMT